MSKIRRITQLLFLGFFVFLLFQARFPYQRIIPSDLFVRLDPLALAISAIAGRAWISWLWVSAITIFLTVILGRVFCGWVCPMGTTIELTEMAIYKRSKKNEQKKNYQWLKYALLVIVVCSAFFGINLGYYLDPIPLITRIYTILFYPLVMVIANWSAIALGKIGFSALSYVEISQPIYKQVFLTLGIFLGIIGLSSYGSRFFCKNLCPLGALLGLCSRYSLLGKQISEACTDCGICEKICPTSAVVKQSWRDKEPECIKCFVCEARCPEKAIRYSFKTKPARETKIDLGRRKFITAGAIGIGAGVLAPQCLGLKIRPDNLIRPPGALPEMEFLARCSRCGECLKVCPTYVIQSQGLEQGLLGAFAPKMEMRLSGCDQECKICGEICATGAIRKLDLDEKKYAKLGTAEIDQAKCLVYAWDKVCQICDEICPYNAIIFKRQNGKRVPVVVPSRCNGCGWCEAVCPVIGASAIRISANGEIRLKQGSYQKEAKARGIDLSAKDELENFLEIPENTGQ